MPRNRLRRCLLAALLAVSAVWICALMHCEYLTYRYGAQFQDQWSQAALLVRPDRCKVLSYTAASARVYYAGEGGGNTFTFVRDDGDEPRTCSGWTTVWSDSGSADGFIWPYIR